MIRFRFSISSLLLLMVVVSVAATGGHFLRHALQSGVHERAWFVIFTLASPVALLAAMSLFHLAMRMLAPNRKRRRVR